MYVCVRKITNSPILKITRDRVPYLDLANWNKVDLNYYCYYSLKSPSM